MGHLRLHKWQLRTRLDAAANKVGPIQRLCHPSNESQYRLWETCKLRLGEFCGRFWLHWYLHFSALGGRWGPHLDTGGIFADFLQSSIQTGLYWFLGYSPCIAVNGTGWIYAIEFTPFWSWFETSGDIPERRRNVYDYECWTHKTRVYYRVESRENHGVF